MKYLGYFILFSGVCIASSCRTAIVSQSNSQPINDYVNYTLTLQVRNADCGALDNVLGLIREALAPPANLIQMDWQGLYDGPKEIKVGIQLPKKMMNDIYLRLSRIPEIMNVQIE